MVAIRRPAWQIKLLLRHFRLLVQLGGKSRTFIGLFKEFVQAHRADIDLDNIAMGEFWFATDALKQGLVDELNTSDDHILSLFDSHQIYRVKNFYQKS